MEFVLYCLVKENIFSATFSSRKQCLPQGICNMLLNVARLLCCKTNSCLCVILLIHIYPPFFNLFILFLGKGVALSKLSSETSCCRN